MKRYAIILGGALLVILATRGVMSIIHDGLTYPW